LRKSLKPASTFVVALGFLLSAAQYDERYRPAFHFSPRVNWTNDPCGLVYAFGNYQLFFQHNPFANVWGHMSWGHAASVDLVHWKQMPVAIAADKQAAIFTGSSVFDTGNTSGLCRLPSGCIVSIYTGETPKTGTTPERQTQNLAFSEDGLTWTKYTGDPVLDLGRSDTRDPKVFWYEPNKRWIMCMVQADDKKVRLFSSPDLKAWTHLSDFGPQGATGGVWECPDLYSLPVEHQTGKTQWVLKVGLNPGHIAGGSGGQYFIGQFNGTTFTPIDLNGPVHWVDYGHDCYCALTFNHEPSPDTRHMIGWMNNWQYAGDLPTAPWQGSMTLPRTLSLAEVGGSLRLLQRPVEQLRSLRGEVFRFDGANVADLDRHLSEWRHRTQTFEMETSIRLGEAKEITWKLLRGDGEESILGFDVIKNELFFDRSRSATTSFNKTFPSRTSAPLTLYGEPLKLHVFVDRSSVEVFAQDGAIAMTNLVFPKATSTGLSLTTSGGRVDNIQATVWSLRSAWNELKP
jgi:fructan beta-fructosidase